VAISNRAASLVTLELSHAIDKVYEPQRFEPHWAQWWIDSGVSARRQGARQGIFAGDSAAQRDGVLHIGHMLEHAEIDVHRALAPHARRQHAVAARHRHAGIATQMVVERKLAEEGLTRRGLGREAFEGACGNGRRSTATPSSGR